MRNVIQIMPDYKTYEEYCAPRLEKGMSVLPREVVEPVLKYIQERKKKELGYVEEMA